MTTMPRRGVTLVLCAFLGMWSLPVAAGSEAVSPGPPASDFSLTISPTRLTIGQADLGLRQQLQVTNNGSTPMQVEVEKRNFTGGADGALVFQESAPYSASGWLTLSPSSFVVAAHATQVVTAAVTVGPDPEPGDHQVAVVFLVPAGETTANVKINRGVAAPIYVTVLGPTDDSASLSGLDAPGFTVGGPVDVVLKVHDTGTVHRDFRGAAPLVMTGAGTAKPFPDFTVMRGSTRDIATTWDPPLMCVCHPTVSIVNADGAASSVTVRVIVFPLHLLGILVGALLVAYLAFRFGRRRYRATVATAAARLNRSAGSGDA